MSWPSLPAISSPLRAGSSAAYVLSTRPLVGHFQFFGSVACSTPEAPALLVVDFGLDFTGLVFLVALPVLLVVCLGVLTVDIFTPDEPARLRLFEDGAESCNF